MTTKTSDAAKTFYATRNFKDAGTGVGYEAGAKIDADQGSIDNYVAAGLASDERPAAKTVQSDAA